MEICAVAGPRGTSCARLLGTTISRRPARGPATGTLRRYHFTRLKREIIDITAPARPETAARMGVSPTNRPIRTAMQPAPPSPSPSPDVSTRRDPEPGPSAATTRPDRPGHRPLGPVGPPTSRQTCNRARLSRDRAPDDLVDGSRASRAAWRRFALLTSLFVGANQPRASNERAAPPQATQDRQNHHRGPDDSAIGRHPNLFAKGLPANATCRWSITGTPQRKYPRNARPG